MGMHEDDRIRSKQYKYDVISAEDLIYDLTVKGIRGARLLNLLQNRSKDTTLTETDRAVAILAISIVSV
jgi:hypothetical protein